MEINACFLSRSASFLLPSTIYIGDDFGVRVGNDVAHVLDFDCPVLAHADTTNYTPLSARFYSNPTDIHPLNYLSQMHLRLLNGVGGAARGPPPPPRVDSKSQLKGTGRKPLITSLSPRFVSTTMESKSPLQKLLGNNTHQPRPLKRLS